MEVTTYRQRDSVGMVMCPECAVFKWIDLETFEAIQVGKAWIVCPRCGVICAIQVNKAHLTGPIAVDDLLQLPRMVACNKDH